MRENQVIYFLQSLTITVSDPLTIVHTLDTNVLPSRASHVVRIIY